MSPVRFSPEHLWIRLDAQGTGATAGITRFAQQSLGDIMSVDIPALGAHAQGAVVGIVESVKSASDLHLPVSARIVAINPAVQAAPDLATTDPEGAGWLMRLDDIDRAQFDALMDESSYRSWAPAP